MNRTFSLRLKRTAIGAGCLFALSLPIAASAQTAALSFTLGTGIPESAVIGIVDGWTFLVNTPIVLTDLGYYDEGGDGLTQNHPVGLWDNTGSLMASTTVTGACSLGETDFRYSAVSSLVLNPGIYYTVGALRTNGETIRYNVSGVTTAPEVTYVIPVFHLSPTLALPGTPANATSGIFGATFRFRSLPEPGSLLLLSVAGLLALTLRRRKKA